MKEILLLSRKGVLVIASPTGRGNPGGKYIFFVNPGVNIIIYPRNDEVITYVFTYFVPRTSLKYS